MSRLAVDGGTPVRSNLLPYGRQQVDEADIEAIVQVLRGDWLTTGPNIVKFEQAFADFTRVKEAVAVSNGTAALHAAMVALDIGPGDEVIVPPMTFAATANCVLFQGGMPIFADVDPETLLLNPAKVEARITSRTKAIISVDYAGQPCDYAALQTLAEQHGLALVDDACHALGGSYRERPVGSLADLSTFSLHPVKPITTGEGGVITTNNPELARRMRLFRNHGITSDHRQREAQGSWFYEMVELGFNYRLTDFQCVLGLSQLSKLAGWVTRRQEIAQQYDAAFADMPAIQPLHVRPEVSHAYHLYMIKLDLTQLQVTRAEIFKALRAEGIGVNVHYIPIHLHPFYRRRLGVGPGDCPVAEAAYEQLITLPIFPAMRNKDIDDVITACHKVITAYRK
jgi:perosamine synthetase